MSIERMMCLSTAHIDKETSEGLSLGIAADDYGDPNERPFDVPEWFSHLVVYPHGEYGWLIRVPEEDAEREACPEGLDKCLVYAAKRDCHWLLLDRDADQIDDLPAYEW